jgi:hypothetical protein
MLNFIATNYANLLQGLVVVAIGTGISQARFLNHKEAARNAVRHGLVKLGDLNRRMGM